MELNRKAASVGGTEITKLGKRDRGRGRESRWNSVVSPLHS